MEFTRQSIRLIRFVLMGFALSLGVAIASPVVNPKVSDFVCSSSGMVKIVVDGEENSFTNNATLDCPLCASLTGAPIYSLAVFTPPDSLAHTRKSITVAHVATLTTPPLPSRGPPPFSTHH